MFPMCVFSPVNGNGQESSKEWKRIGHVLGHVGNHENGMPPIIAMTADTRQGNRQHCLTAGTDDSPSQPMSKEELKLTPERWKKRPAPVAEPLDISVLDNLRLIQEEGEPDIVTELIDLFLEDAPSRLATMRDAMAQKQAEALQRAAHALKGSSANMGAQRLAALCAQLEQQGRTGSVDGADVVLAEVETEFARVREALASQRR